jgi:hypothetical protein
MKGQPAGAAYLQGVLSKITDPELKAKAEAVFANALVQTEVGNGVVGQAEIDRQLQDLKAKTDEVEGLKTDLAAREESLTKWHGDLTGWADTNKEFIRLGKAAKEGKVPEPKVVAAAVPEGVLTEEKFQEALKSELGGVLGFAVDQNALTGRHFELFGKMLDIRPLIQHPKIREIGLNGVYELVHADALKAKTEELAKTAEEKIRADERAKVAAGRVDMPYPSPSGVGSGSPLDALKPSGSNELVDAATLEYNRLVAARG